MDDESIERMLVDLFRHWFRSDNLSELLNGKEDAESALKRQELFNQAKDIAKRHLTTDSTQQSN